MQFLNTKFNFNNKLLWCFLILFFALRIFWSINFPMTNDEVYYWDWSRDLQLSYVDAPPLVAWISYLGRYFFDGSTGARFFVPFMHLISTFFILKSTEILAQLKNIELKNRSVFYLLLLTEISPAFNLEGFLLLPDASLLAGISGAVYFFFKIVFSSRCFFINASGFGFFIGIGALSKYHVFPIVLGFFCASILLLRKEFIKKHFLFWLFSSIIAIIISSPVLIWNIQNHFASFLFQGQHGFSHFSINFKAFGRYLLGMLFYLWPWFCIPLLYFAFKNFFNKKFFKNYNMIFIFPFLFIFTLILFSALGKQALPHWAMPGFYLLIPAFVLQWNPLEGKNKKTWKALFIVSTILSILPPSLFSIQSFNQFIVKTFVYFTGNANALAQAIQWESLEKELKSQQNIEIENKPYHLLKNELCSKNSPYELASLRWYWTAQMAFHFKNNPRVFNFDLEKTSFYSWRDPLYKLANCPFIIIGSQDHFDENKIKEIMNIEDIKYFALDPYPGVKMVYVKGIMKEEGYLLKVFHETEGKTRY